MPKRKKLPPLSQKTSLRLVFVATLSTQSAKKIAECLIKQQLAACVNVIGPISSYYRWKNRFCEDREALLIIKTKKSCLPRLTSEIQRRHEAQVPEIISLPILEGLNAYLRWIQESTS